jgi:hypothetical protein
MRRNVVESQSVAIIFSVILCGGRNGRSPMMLVSEPMMTPNMKPPISMEKME